MESLSFSWDSQKNKSNKVKHGVDFEEAQTVFYDEKARLIFDPDHSHEEERFILLGLSYHLRVLIVCHCYRESETNIRIISARKATEKETQQYREHNHER